MARSKNYGTAIGYVLVTSKYTQWKAELDVLYKDDSMMVLRDWPDTPLPKYFLVAREINDQVWKQAHLFMRTLNTGGIQVELFVEEINSDFDTIVSTFITREKAREINKRLMNGEVLTYDELCGK